jgi:hypothetical protein
VKLPVAGPIPYAKATSGAGVTAPLALVPGDQVITAANAAGKIVVRPAPAGSIPQVVFTLPTVGWSLYDPQSTIDPAAPFSACLRPLVGTSGNLSRRAAPAPAV